MRLEGISVSTFPGMHWEKATNLCNAISFFTIREAVSLDLGVGSNMLISSSGKSLPSLKRNCQKKYGV